MTAIDSNSLPRSQAAISEPVRATAKQKKGELLVDRPPESSNPAKPKIFVAVVILMTLLPIGLGFSLGSFAPRLPSLDWTLLIDKRTSEIAAATTTPKIIFVGGSNLRFGLNADALTKELGVPVINYGLHASLGIDVIADRAAQFIKPGDFVVYAPELSHFRKSGDGGYSDDLRIDFLAEHPSPTIDPKLQSFPAREWARARSRCNRIRAKVEKIFDTAFVKATTAADPTESAGHDTISPYDVEAIGAHGELTVPRPEPKPLSRWQYSDPPKTLADMDLTASRGVAGFILLKKVCDERHATLCVMPPMRLNVEKFDQREILKMERAFCDYAVVNGAKLLLPPGENILPVEDGYDTDYHLNDHGVAIMQPRIEAALRRAGIRA